MTLHLPQTEEARTEALALPNLPCTFPEPSLNLQARTEALALLGVTSNLVTPRNGEIVISATQDFLTGSYLLSLPSVFLTRDQFARLAVYMGDASEAIELPPPAILKPVEMWTGKQLFSLMLRPTSASPLVVNLECPNKKYNTARLKPEPYQMCPDDGYVTFHNSELLAGIMDKSVLGGGTKNSLFAVREITIYLVSRRGLLSISATFTYDGGHFSQVLLRDHSPEASALAMGRLAKVLKQRARCP